MKLLGVFPFLIVKRSYLNIIENRDINYYLSGSETYGALPKLHINDLIPFKDKIQRSIIVPTEVEKYLKS